MLTFVKWQKNHRKLLNNIVLLSIIVLVIFTLININNIIGVYPTSTYLKNCSVWSIQKANNFSWQTFTGKEGSEYFTDKMMEKYFSDGVDLEYIKEFKVVSEGHIKKFTIVNTSVPSISFISYRKIVDKDITREYNTEITYTFKFQGYRWLIDNISFKQL